MAGASQKERENFKVVALTQAEEDHYEWTAYRNAPKPDSAIGSVAHLAKGALGAGVMSVHVGFKNAGLLPAMCITVFSCVYVGYCLYILVKCSHILYKRTHVSTMSYPDVGECAMACFPNHKISKHSKVFRYIIDILICLELYGACVAYQLMISKTIKQLVENTTIDTLEGAPGYPHLRVYLAIMIVPVIAICLITELKWLAPFSLVANLLIVLCIGVTIYYVTERNPGFENVKWTKDFVGPIEYLGMAMFSMSCVGLVMPVTNNMKNPHNYATVMLIGMASIGIIVFSMGFFGYIAFLEECQSPIILNFSRTVFAKILKGMIAFMIYVTHSLNFFAPFHLCWTYIKPKHNQEKLLRWEIFYRIIFVILIALVAIAFPHINTMLSLIGAVCISNLAFIWPNLIEMMVLYIRPGYGRFRWRLWKSIILISIGVIILIVGTAISLRAVIMTFL